MTSVSLSKHPYEEVRSHQKGICDEMIETIYELYCWKQTFIEGETRISLN